jgi:Fe-S oxidoreductase
VTFPVDQEGREFVFFAPVSDFIMEADTLMGIGLALSAGGSGDDWTIGSQYFDGINYGLFYNDWVLERIITELVEEARRLKARKILIGECGHAARTARAFATTFCGPDAPEVVHIIAHTHRAFREGRLRLTPGAITERVTYHDPCNTGRNKWLLDEPRELLAACCSDFVEMAPTREHNLCCGGGGGTVSVDELRPYRTGICGAKKAEQLAATGAKYVVAPCANCKKQLRELVEDHALDMQVVGLHDLLYRAIARD